MTTGPGSRRRPLAFAVVVSVMAVVALATTIAWAVWSAKRTAATMVAHRGPAPAGLGGPLVTPADSGMAYSEVPLGARDGTKLAGWWIIPADGRRRPDLAVVVMGHAADDAGKASLLRLAPALHAAGYILLLFDFRSYGASEGARTTHGYIEQQDVEAAVRLARERAVGAPIALYGVGLGATAVLMATAGDPGVACAIVDSPWATWDGAFFARPGAMGREPGDLRHWQSSDLVPRPLVLQALKREVGFAFGTKSVREPVVVAPLAGSRPVMAIYGETDPFIPFREQIRIVAGLGTPNATWAWRAPGAGHVGAYDSAPDEYRARAVEFLDAAMVEWGNRSQ